MQTIGDGGGSRFADDPLDFKPGQLAGRFGGAALSITEISWRTDDRFFNRHTEMPFGIFFELFDNKGRKLLRQK